MPIKNNIKRPLKILFFIYITLPFIFTIFQTIYSVLQPVYLYPTSNLISDAPIDKFINLEKIELLKSSENHGIFSANSENFFSETIMTLNDNVVTWLDQSSGAPVDGILSSFLISSNYRQYDRKISPDGVMFKKRNKYLYPYTYITEITNGEIISGCSSEQKLQVKKYFGYLPENCHIWELSVKIKKLNYNGTEIKKVYGEDIIRPYAILWTKSPQLHKPSFLEYSILNRIGDNLISFYLLPIEIMVLSGYC